MQAVFVKARGGHAPRLADAVRPDVRRRLRRLAALHRARPAASTVDGGGLSQRRERVAPRRSSVATRRSRRSPPSGSSEWRGRLLEDGVLSRRTIQKMLVILHGILKRAKRSGWISTNAAEDVERVAVKRSGDFNVLSPAEVEAVARAADELSRRDLHGRRVHRSADGRAARAAVDRRRLCETHGPRARQLHARPARAAEVGEGPVGAADRPGRARARRAERARALHRPG